MNLYTAVSWNLWFMDHNIVMKSTLVYVRKNIMLFVNSLLVKDILFSCNFVSYDDKKCLQKYSYRCYVLTYSGFLQVFPLR